MKRLFAVVLSCLSLCFSVLAQEASKPPVIVERNDGMIEISFDETGEGITLEAFIKICQQNTGYNFTFADDAKGNLAKKIRIFGKKIIQKSRFYPFFQTVMKINNFVCVEMGKGSEKIIVIMDNSTSQPANKSTIAANSVFLTDPKELDEYASQPGTLVTTVFTLKYQNAQRLQASLRQYLTDQQLEKVFNVGDTGLIISSFGPNVYAIKRLIDLMDVPPERAEPPVMEIVPLEYAAAEELEPILTELIEKRAKARAGGAARAGGEGVTGALQTEEEYEVKIIPDPRTSSIIVQASRNDLVWVLDLIQRLDSKVESPESNFHIHSVKNVEAKKLSDSLSKFLEQTQTAIQQAQTTTAGRAGGAPAAQPKEQKPVVIADEQTNSIMITASKTKWVEIKNLIERLDVRQNQVLIETALVELSLEDNLNIGVEIAKLSGSSLPEAGDPAKPGAVTNFGGIGSYDTTLNATGFPTEQTVDPNSKGLLAGLITGNDVKLPVLLRALKTKSNANVLSIPSVLVTNNTKASIVSETTKQTQQIQTQTNSPPIQGAGPSGSAGITLNISPSISASNYLRLNIDLKISSFGSGGSATTLPDINNRHMTTSVFVPDGSTLYIGGIVTDSKTEADSGVPILMDIPIIGQLFRSSSKSSNKLTLYFFITPRIVKEADFSDLVDLSYRKKLDANNVIGSEQLLKIDPQFTPLGVPGETPDKEMKKTESIYFDIPLYRSPSEQKPEENKNPK